MFQSTEQALVIIDVQNFYFFGDDPTEGNVEASTKAAELLAYFREKNQPVFHVKHISKSDDSSDEFRFMTDIHKSVTPLENEFVICKTTPGSFNKTDLLAKLQSLGVRELVICGMMSHMCVDTTTREAFDLGFKCTVIHDACATRNLEFNGTPIPAKYVHHSAMAALAFAFAEVISVEEFIRKNNG